jgi:methionyl-tRNA formyltransferase
MKIIFMGTPEFAVPSLRILVDNGYDVVAVITAPDKPAGRGQKIQMSPVKIFAQARNIPVLQPIRLSDPAFLSELKELNADLQIIVAFRMLPEAVWKMPPLGTFNLHGSLLPQYRGAAPIQRAVMNGETETGLTTFFLQHEIDTGNLILQKKIEIGSEETSGELHDRMMNSGAELVLDSVRLIESGKVQIIPQSGLIPPGTPLKAAPKIFREDCKLDFTRNIRDLFNQVRGLNPWPGAFFEFQTDDGLAPKAVKIFRCRMIPAGTVLTHELHTDNRTYMRISAADGFLDVLEMQLPGKKRMTVTELLKGFHFDVNGMVL